MRMRHVLTSAVIATAAVLVSALPVYAQVAPSLGAAQSFAVLAGSTVTNTGSTVVTGDLGLSPGTAVTGFPPGTVVSGSIYTNNGVALSAQNAATTAYNNLTSQGCTLDLTGQDLGGLVLTPGVYCFGAAAQLTGVLTLNALGDPNAVFIFKIGSALTTASGSSVLLINTASACNVFFQVGASATLGTGSHVEGTVIALVSITLTTGASVSGHVFARSGAVTLDTNSVTGSCLGAPVCPVLSMLPALLPSGAVGTSYGQSLAASGGAAPYAYSLTSGALPPGVTLTSAGNLTGVPTVAGTYSVTIRGTDANGCFVSMAYSITIAPAFVCPVLALTPLTLPPGFIGTPYSQTLTASGGTAPYTFSIASGALPAGLSLTTSGLVSGTPTSAGAASAVIRATDANGCAVNLQYAIVIAPAAIACPSITLQPARLPVGIVGTPYTLTLIGAGGTGPYIFTIAAGALPSGVVLAPSGVVSGTPTVAATTSVTIRGTDANGCFADVVSSVVIAASPIACPVITLLPAVLPNGSIGAPYNQTLTASGGGAPYVYTLTSGTLPVGTTLTAAGVVAGTPTVAATSTFTIRATDANGCFLERTFTVLMATSVPTLPEVFAMGLGLSLLAIGFAQLKRRSATRRST